MTFSRATRRCSPAAQESLCLTHGNLRRPSDRKTQAEADALAALAKRNGCSKAALMRELLRDGLAPLLEG